MEDGVSFFFDSYALIEIFKGSKSYHQYRENKIVTSYAHLYETYYILRQFFSEQEIENYFIHLQKFCISLKFSWIKEATEFRLENKRKELSYADCLGYIISKELNIRFLTGDHQFKSLPNVEYIK